VTLINNGKNCTLSGCGNNNRCYERKDWLDAGGSLEAVWSVGNNLEFDSISIGWIPAPEHEIIQDLDLHSKYMLNNLIIADV
jgi:hypothetical protein